MLILAKIGFIRVFIYCIVYMYCEPSDEEMEKK